jgi:hypothetical protein
VIPSHAHTTLRDVGVVGQHPCAERGRRWEDLSVQETDAAKGMLCADFGTSDNPEATPDGPNLTAQRPFRAIQILQTWPRTRATSAG